MMSTISIKWKTNYNKKQILLNSTMQIVNNQVRIPMRMMLTMEVSMMSINMLLIETYVIEVSLIWVILVIIKELFLVS